MTAVLRRAGRGRSARDSVVLGRRSCLWCVGLASASTARNRPAQSFTSCSATVLRIALIRRVSSLGAACIAVTIAAFMPLMS